MDVKVKLMNPQSLLSKAVPLSIKLHHARLLTKKMKHVNRDAEQLKA